MPVADLAHCLDDGKPTTIKFNNFWEIYTDDGEEESILEEPELLLEAETHEPGDGQGGESVQEWDTVAERGTASRPASTVSAASLVPAEALGARDGDTRDARHRDTDDVVQTVHIEERRRSPERVRDASLRPDAVPFARERQDGVLSRPRRR